MSLSGRIWGHLWTYLWTIGPALLASLHLLVFCNVCSCAILAALGILIPVWRATRVDPMTALREN